MFENLARFFKKIFKAESQEASSVNAAKERLHLVLMQDRANVSADFLDMMKQEIIEVIKKYIDVDENAIDVRLTNKTNEDGTNGAPALYANIPIISIKEEAKHSEIKQKEEKADKKEEKRVEEEAKKVIEQETRKEAEEIEERTANNLKEEKAEVEKRKVKE